MKKIVIFLALLFSIGIAIWSRDEPLHDETIRLLQKSGDTEGERVYFSLLGFTSSADKDPVEQGRKLVERHRASENPSAQGQAAELHFTENVLSVCDKNKTNAVACIVQNRAAIENVLGQNKVLLDRYENLLNGVRFSQPAQAGAAHLATPFMDLQRAKFALWAKAILLVKDGHIASGIALLQKDARFWRMLFAQSENMLTRMVSVAMLRKQYEILSHLLIEFPMLGATEKDRLLKIATPLSSEELSFRRALAGEYRTAAELLADLDKIAPSKEPACVEKNSKECVNASWLPDWSLENPFWRKTPLYRHNATLNRQARLVERWAAFSELPAPEMVKQRESYTQALQTEFKPTNVSSFGLYNRIGKGLVATGFVDVGGYSLKAHDLDGLLRLINLQMQIAAFKVPGERIGPFLQTSEAGLTNPYSGEAMIWDAKERTLSFPARGDEDGGEVAVTLENPKSLLVSTVNNPTR